MMLKSLEHLNPEVAAELLASIPIPVTDIDALYTINSVINLQLAAVNELRIKLNIREGDESSGAQKRIAKGISEEISRLILPGNVQSEALHRAGNAGRLLSSLYSVKFYPTTEGRFTDGLVSRKAINMTVNSPDSVHHMTGGNYPDRAAPISLFLKWFDRSEGRSASWLVVLGERRDQTFLVTSAWWILPSWLTNKVPLEPNDSDAPLQALTGLVLKFGRDLNVNTEIHRLIVNKFFSADFIDFKESINFSDSTRSPHQGDIAYSNAGAGLIYVTIAYNISLVEYWSNLSENGFIRKPAKKVSSKLR